jgi:hypothetical protein
VEQDEVAHDGEAQAHAAVRALERLRALGEGLEEPLAQRRGQACAVVLDAQHDGAVLARRTHRDAPAGRHELGRVGEQIA